jgi:hypothetical protein
MIYSSHLSGPDPLFDPVFQGQQFSFSLGQHDPYYGIGPAKVSPGIQGRLAYGETASFPCSGGAWFTPWHRLAVSGSRGSEECPANAQIWRPGAFPGLGKELARHKSDGAKQHPLVRIL